MKRVLYFVLACLTIIYIGFLCYTNIVGMTADWMYYLSVYGGLSIALLYAAINFFGSPLKIVFFVLLIVATIVLVLTIVMPDVFRQLFKIGESAEGFINLIKM